MADTYKSGTWNGGEIRRDTSGRFPRSTQDQSKAGTNENQTQFNLRHGQTETLSIPYPEATYWSSRTGNKVFSVTTTDCLIVDGSGNVILDAGGNAILCP